MNDDLAALIHRHTVAGGFSNTVAIAEEAYEMGKRERALPDRDVEMRARECLATLSREFKRWLEIGPNAQPHYPNAGRPFSTGDRRCYRGV